jgi:uncharacterized membrane protein
LALGETLTLTVALGTFFTVAGVILLSWNRQGISTIVKSALLFATGAAVIRGINQTVGKFGLNFMPNPFMAGFISFIVAFFSAILWYRFRNGHLPLPYRLHRKGVLLFTLTGVGIGIAVWCMYGALALGQVVVVAPIVGAYPMFALLTAVIFKQESVTRRIVMGVFIVVGGGVLISIGSAY